MSMKPVHGDGSEPIAGKIAPNLVNSANEHPSGKFGAVAHNTVTQPKYEGNQAKPMPANLVSHAQEKFVGHEEPEFAGGGGSAEGSK